jgi:hypothetical protein
VLEGGFVSVVHARDFRSGYSCQCKAAAMMIVSAGRAGVSWPVLGRLVFVWTIRCGNFADSGEHLSWQQKVRNTN